MPCSDIGYDLHASGRSLAAAKANNLGYLNGARSSTRDLAYGRGNGLGYITTGPNYVRRQRRSPKPRNVTVSDMPPDVELLLPELAAQAPVTGEQVFEGANAKGWNLTHAQANTLAAKANSYA